MTEIEDHVKVAELRNQVEAMVDRLDEATTNLEMKSPTDMLELVTRYEHECFAMVVSLELGGMKPEYIDGSLEVHPLLIAAWDRWRAADARLTEVLRLMGVELGQ